MKIIRLSKKYVTSKAPWISLGRVEKQKPDGQYSESGYHHQEIDDKGGEFRHHGKKSVEHQ
jgi:hypothetical protein